MVEMTPAILEKLNNFCAAAYPREACGYLLGRKTNSVWEVHSLHAGTNLSPVEVRDRFELDPEERGCVEKLARELGVEIIGFYHSHPDHDVYFSETDLKNSEEYQWGRPWVPPTFAYVVLSVHAGTVQSIGAFQVFDGESQNLIFKIK